MSSELRRRRLDDEARVKMEALSVRMLFAVAPWYELGCCWGARCGGMAEGSGELEGNWWEKCTGVPLAVVGWGCATPPPRTCEGAVDWIVVRVVVSECSEALGDEKVLPPPIRWLLPVSALERAECSVSGMVATVGAVDLLLLARARCWSSAASSTEVKLSLERARGVSGVEKERWAGALAVTTADSGYGLFFAAAFLAVVFLLLPEPPGESEDEGLRFARRFIQPAKGRLRAWRSSEGRISAEDGGGEVGTYREAAMLLGPWPCCAVR